MKNETNEIDNTMITDAVATKSLTIDPTLDKYLKSHKNSGNTYKSVAANCYVNPDLSYNIANAQGNIGTGRLNINQVLALASRSLYLLASNGSGRLQHYLNSGYADCPSNSDITVSSLYDVMDQSELDKQYSIKLSLDTILRLNLSAGLSKTVLNDLTLVENKLKTKQQFDTILAIADSYVVNDDNTLQITIESRLLESIVKKLTHINYIVDSDFSFAPDSTSLIIITARLISVDSGADND